MANGNCVVGANLKGRVENMEKRFDKLDGTLERVFNKLDELKEGWQKRPSWTASALLAFLTSTTVGLLVTLFRVIK